MIDRPLTGDPVTCRSIVTVKVLPGVVVPDMVRSAVRFAAAAGLTVDRTASAINNTNALVNILFIFYSSVI